MNRKSSRRSLTGTAVLLVALALVPRTGTSDVPTNRTAIIRGQKAGRGVVWRTGSQSFDDLLRAYANVLDRHGSDHPVAVLIDDALPISWIWVAAALAPKAPLNNVRVFVVMRANEKMFEVKPAPSMPVGTPIE